MAKSVFFEMDAKSSSIIKKEEKDAMKRGIK